jgi:hypothetical protein
MPLFKTRFNLKNNENGKSLTLIKNIIVPDGNDEDLAAKQTAEELAKKRTNQDKGWTWTLKALEEAGR